MPVVNLVLLFLVVMSMVVLLVTVVVYVRLVVTGLSGCYQSSPIHVYIL